MTVTGLDAAVLGVEDIQSARKFYTDFGLREIEGGDCGAEFQTLDGCQILLRSPTEGGLPPAVAGGSTIREVVWAVADLSDAERVGALLETGRPVSQDADGTVHTIDDDGYGIAFRPTRKSAFQPGVVSLNVFGREPLRGLNRRYDHGAPIRPATLGHVVLYTPDVARSMRFYTEKLGFTVSDSFLGGAGAFLRSPGSTDHHTLFLIRHPDGKRGMHHLSFPVTDFSEVMMGGKLMTSQGWTTKFGPGRHVIGSNCFWYFNSPCGGAMEMSADMDRADANWEAREWDYCPENVAAWSTTFNAPTGK